MARVIDFHLKGYDEANAAFRALPPALMGRAVRPALRAGARVVMIRAKALAPRLTHRLAGGRWTITRSKRRNMVGVVVRVPARAALHIRRGAPGFYPYSQEFGWKPYGGAPQQGPLPFVPGQRGRKSAVARGGMTARAARATLTSHVRKVPGKRFMRQALFGSRGMVLSAIAAKVMERVGQFTPAGIRQRSSDWSDDGEAA